MAPRVSSLSVLLLCVALLISAVKAGDDPLEKAFGANAADKSIFVRLVAGLKLRADEDKTIGTWFVPTDRAFNAFLKDMGLTADELLARPQLVDAILSYHFVPGVAIKDFAVKDKASGNKDLISTDASNPSLLRTGDVNNDLDAFRSAATGQVTLVDMQGNRVSVLGKPTVYGSLIFWDVSNVLMSGQYFFNTRGAVRYYPEWRTFQELYQRAAPASAALAGSFAGRSDFTFLIPSDDALKPAVQALSKAGAADLSQLLEYHVVPGMKPVPTGWKNGQTVDTLLKGNTLKAQLSEAPYTDPFDGSTKQGPVLTLVPEVGKPAKVTLLNIYAGKSILQGVDGPLVPNTAVAKALGAAPADAGAGGKTTTEKAPAASAPAAKAPTTAGRKLLQGNRGSGGSRTRGAANNQWAAMNTQAAIRAAASGRVPASYATAAGSRNTRAAAAGCVNCLRWDGRF